MLQKSKVPNYKPSKDIQVAYDSFSGGLNTIFKPTELRENELAQADNLMLIGQGTPTGRWGSQLSHLVGESGRVRLLDAYYNSLTSTNLLLSLTDSGYLVKRSGASYAILTGASFMSGANLQSEQLGNQTYIASASQAFIKFNGTNLIPYVGLSVPTNVSLSQLSAASGFNTYSWIITASSLTGETLASVSKSLSSLPLDLTQTSVRVSWNLVSTAGATVVGYNVYRGFPGDETYIASVGQSLTPQYIDTGTPQADTIFPPNADGTSGIKAKYILKFDDRLLLAGVAGEPSRLFISARYPYHDRFTAIDGGGSVLISPNDGDDITGLGIAGNQGMSTGGSLPPASAVLVFKKNSVHRVVLSNVALGNFNILDPQAQLLTASNGCSSADTVVPVENDTFYFGRKGLYSVGQEPNFLNQIRTNELSARIRPYIQNLSDTDFREACAGYVDNKYLLSFPTKKETMIYDRERAAFMGPWKTPFGITKWLKYFDTDGTEKWMAGTAGVSSTGNGLSASVPTVQQFATTFKTDNGTSIYKILRTKKEDFGEWSVFKILKLFYVLVRNVTGSVEVNLRLEDRTGNTVTSKSFSITSDVGSGGWGNDEWGDQQYGQTDATISLTGDELVRFARIYKNFRVMQVEVISSAANSQFEFLGLRATAQGLGDESLPASVKV